MQFVGFGLTPSLVFFFASVNTKLGVFIFDKDTIPGYVLFFEHLAAAVLVMFVSSIKSKVQKKDNKSTSSNFTKGIVLYLAVFFLIRACSAFIEVENTPIFIQVKGLDPHDPKTTEQVAIFFLELGIGSLVVFILTGFVTLKVPLPILIGFSLTICIVGSLLLTFHPSFIRFLLGSIAIWVIGSTITVAIGVASFSRMVERDLGKDKLGVMMGWYTVLGAFGSCIARLALGLKDPSYVLIVAAGCDFVCLVLLGLYHYYHDFRPRLPSIVEERAGFIQ